MVVLFKGESSSPVQLIWLDLKPRYHLVYLT